MADKTLSSALARKHLDKRLTPLRSSTAVQRPDKGWVRAIRDALGMNARQLAARLNVSQPTITNIEKNEANDTITLKRLREAAAALDCTLVYALVPNTSLQQIVEDRARHIADAQLARTHHTMSLEDQELDDADRHAERQRLMHRLLDGHPRHLWEMP
jgi:predicted DNA-binding mobile mystery protein A